MSTNKQIRVKPSIKTTLFADQVKLAQVAAFVGITSWTLRYVWLDDNKNYKITPALICGLAKYMGVKESEVTEEFHPIKAESTVN